MKSPCTEMGKLKGSAYLEVVGGIVEFVSGRKFDKSVRPLS